MTEQQYICTKCNWVGTDPEKLNPHGDMLGCRRCGKYLVKPFGPPAEPKTGGGIDISFDAESMRLVKFTVDEEGTPTIIEEEPPTSAP